MGCKSTPIKTLRAAPFPRLIKSTPNTGASGELGAGYAAQLKICAASPPSTYVARTRRSLNDFQTSVVVVTPNRAFTRVLNASSNDVASSSRLGPHVRSSVSVTNAACRRNVNKDGGDGGDNDDDEHDVDVDDSFDRSDDVDATLDASAFIHLFLLKSSGFVLRFDAVAPSNGVGNPRARARVIVVVVIDSVIPIASGYRRYRIVRARRSGDKRAVGKSSRHTSSRRTTARARSNTHTHTTTSVMHVFAASVSRVAPTRVCGTRTRRQTVSARLRQHSTSARARADTETDSDSAAPITRRDAVARTATAFAAFAAAALSTTSNVDAAFAKDLKEMEAEKAARKAALRAAAEASAKSGRGEAAFDDAAYGVSEDARTPNAHSRQEEGLKEALRNNV